MEHIAQTDGDWHLIDLGHVPNGDAAALTKDAMFAAGLECREEQFLQVNSIKLEPTWDAQFESLPKELADRYVACEQKLAAEGDVTFLRYRPIGSWHGETERNRGMLSSLEILRVNQRNGMKAEGSETPAWNRLEFMRDIHGPAVDAAVAEVNLLKVDNRAVAGAYAFHRDGVVEVVDIAIGPKLESITPDVLVGRMLQDSIQRGDNVVYLPHRDANRFEWQNATTQTVRLTHFADPQQQAQLSGLTERMWNWVAGKSRTVDVSLGV